MAKNSGMTIELDLDTKKVDKGMKDINSSLSKNSKSLKTINEQLRYDANNVDLWKQKQTLLNTSITQTKSKLDLMNRELEEASIKLKTGEISEKQFEKMQAGVIKTETQLKKLNYELRNTKQKLGELSQQNFQKLERIGTSLTNSLTKPIIALTTAIVTLGIKTAYTLDDMADNASKIGLTAEEYQKLAYAMEIMAVDSTTMQRAFIKINAMLGDIALGNSLEASQNLHLLGLTLEDIENKSAYEVFEVLRQALSEIEDETLRVALANEFFGDRIGSELMPMLTAENGVYENLIARAEELGIATNEQANKSGELTDNITDLQIRMRSLGYTLLDALMPVINKIVDKLTNDIIPAIKIYIEKFNSLSDTTKKIIVIILGVIMAIGPLLTVVGKLGIFVNGAITKLPQIISLISKIVGGLNPVVLIILAVVSSLIYLYKTNEEVRNSINNLFNTAKTLILDVMAILKQLWDAVKPILSILLNMIGQLLDSIAPLVVTFIDMISTRLKGLMPILNLLADIINNIIVPIILKAINRLQPLIDFLTTVISWIAKGIEYVVKFEQSINNLVSKAFGNSKLGELFSNLGLSKLFVSKGSTSNVTNTTQNVTNNVTINTSSSKFDTDSINNALGGIYV